MKLPIPQDFNDWKIWARELVRRLELSNSVAELAKRLAAGSGVTLTYDGQKQVITLATSGSGGLDVLDESVTILTPASALDFVGAGVTVTDAGGGIAQVSIPGGGGGAGEVVERPHVKPVLSAFSWVNQNTTTATEEDFGISMAQPRTTAGWGLLVQAAPATPYEIVARFNFMLRVVGDAQVGFCWRDSSSGQLHFVRFEQNSGIPDPAIVAWNSASSYNSNTQNNERIYPTPRWVKLADDGTDRSIHFSQDGMTWSRLWSGGRTTFMTPDQVGFGIGNFLNTTPYIDALLTVLSWEHL